MVLESWSDQRHVVIGVVHAPPLPGTPRYGGSWTDVQNFVRSDAASLVEGGVDGLILENFGDAPFFPRCVPIDVVAHMTQLASILRSQFDVPLGINVLRNDGVGALAIAAATDAQFIRVNVLCGARVTDQGIVEGIAHDLLRARNGLQSHVKIVADVDVKHSATLAPRPLEDEVADLIERGLADAVIVSGMATGQAVLSEHVRRVKHVAGNTSVLVGSGVTPENIAEYGSAADGFIIGTGFKRDGVCTHEVDVMRVRALMAVIRR